MDDRNRPSVLETRDEHDAYPLPIPSAPLPDGSLSLRHRRSREYLNRQWHAGLSPRVYRSLLANGFRNRAAVLQAWERGDMIPGRYPGIGKQAIAQIRCWLFPRHCGSAPPSRSPRQIAVTLEPDAQEALKRLKYHDESPQAAINRLLIESDRDMQTLAEALDPEVLSSSLDG
ncbi:MAG: hypothetical protein UMU75_00070 [Halomonas sp.]|nr:hypothetical protein [Halomonas sp.]